MKRTWISRNTSAVLSVPTFKPRDMALPKQCTIDDVIRWPDQAAQWLGVSVDWMRKRGTRFPGVIVESRKVVLFHPRTYIERRLKPLNGKKAA